MTRDEINAFGDRIKAHLLDGDSAIIIAVGAYPPSPDCRVDSVVATIRGGVGKADQTFEGHAIDLDSALMIARGKLRDARAAHAKSIAISNTPSERQSHE